MSIFTWSESRIRNFTFWDMGIFKLCLIAFTLLIAKFWGGILALDWYWYALVFALTYVWMVSRMFRKPAGRST